MARDCLPAFLLFESNVYIFIGELIEKGKSLSILLEEKNRIVLNKKNNEKKGYIDEEQNAQLGRCLRDIQELHKWFSSQQIKTIEIFDMYFNVRKLGL